jgi:hypothetical protein
MKIIFWNGLLVLLLGVASLLVPIPANERVDNHPERVSPIVSIAMIVGGGALTVAGLGKNWRGVLL